MPYVFLALPGKEKQQTCATHSYNPLWCLCPVCSLHCLVKNTRPVQHIFTTPSGVINAVCVFLAPPIKETADLHILTTPSGVFLMPCAFLAQKQQICATHSQNTLWCVFNAVCVPCTACKKAADLCNKILQHLWCVFNAVCSLHRNSRSVQHILTTPSGVFLMPCHGTYVFLALPGKETADLCNTFLQHPLVCF
jgi:hypothetical protein